MPLLSDLRTRAKELLDGTLYEGVPSAENDEANLALRPNDLRWLGMPPTDVGVDAAQLDRGFWLECVGYANEQQPDGPNSYDVLSPRTVLLEVAIAYRYAQDGESATAIEPLLNVYDTETASVVAYSPRERAAGDVHRIQRAFQESAMWGALSVPVTRDAVVPPVAGVVRAASDGPDETDAGGFLVVTTRFRAVITVEQRATYR